MEKTLPVIDSQEEIKVYGLNTKIPLDAEILGIVKVGDTGFTINCGYSVVLEKVKQEARKAGGNAVKIIKHTPPGFSTCHIIMAKILRVDNSSITTHLNREFVSLNRDYAILNIYSVSSPDNFVSYDLYLGDSVLCRVTNNLKKTIAIKKEGLTSIWAKTGTRAEIQIVFKFGEIYYLRCYQSTENLVDRPIIEIIDTTTGSQEFGHWYY